MDPHDSRALSQPPSFALDLAKLPRELVHGILDNLPLVKILQILSHRNQFLDGCVLTHISYRQLFTSQPDISSVIDYFILYREICRFTQKSISASHTVLSRGPSAFHSRTYFAYKIYDLQLVFIQQIKKTLTLNALDLALLRAHATTDYPAGLGNSCSDFTTRWNWIKEAKLKLNESKALQLNTAADLMSEFPEKLMLKKPLDPSQAGPRPNLEHIANGLRHQAKKTRRDGRLHTQFQGRCFPGIESIELIPYDRSLWMFLDTLEKYPVVNEDLEVEGQRQNISLSEEAGESAKSSDEKGKRKTTFEESFRYPDDIAANIKTVMDGLMYIYTGSPLLVVPRLQWSPSYPVGSSEEKKKPVFYVEMESHSVGLPEILHRCPARKIMPHDEREYLWLSAFLKVVTWMENKLETEKEEKKH